MPNLERSSAGLPELKTQVLPAQTKGSVLRMAELPTQDLGSYAETRDTPRTQQEGFVLHTEGSQPVEGVLVLNKP